MHVYGTISFNNINSFWSHTVQKLLDTAKGDSPRVWRCGMPQKELWCIVMLSSFTDFWSENVWNSELGWITLFWDVKNTQIPATQDWFSKYKVLYLEVELESGRKEVVFKGKLLSRQYHFSQLTVRVLYMKILDYQNTAIDSKKEKTRLFLIGSWPLTMCEPLILDVHYKILATHTQTGRGFGNRTWFGFVSTFINFYFYCLRKSYIVNKWLYLFRQYYMCVFVACKGSRLIYHPDIECNKSL